MALSPNIPTSFVPRPMQTPDGHIRARRYVSIFNVLCFSILFITVSAAAGLYFYSNYLTNILNEKTTIIKNAEDPSHNVEVENFIRLRDRLALSKSLIEDHVTLSVFFDALEKLTLQNVQFNTLTVTVAADRSATMVISGTAKNFNTLAAQSNALGTDKRIKRAIFSDIAAGTSPGSGISFKLTAVLDRPLVTGAPFGASSAPSIITPVTVPVTQLPGVVTTVPLTATSAPATTSVKKVLPPVPAKLPVGTTTQKI